MGASDKLVVGNQYSRADIYKALDVPAAQRRGNWETGYNQFNGEYFVFVNVETPGRTGHNYNDAWQADGSLFWHGKLNSHVNQPGIKRMLADTTSCHFFTRVDNRNVLFTYQGIGKVVSFNDVSPVEVYWVFPDSEPEVVDVPNVSVNHQRRRISRSNRMACIGHYGEKCWVCGIDFVEKYGVLGEGYIRVCHNNYDQPTPINDPVAELRPICPNCLAMLNRRRDGVFTVDSFREYLHQLK